MHSHTHRCVYRPFHEVRQFLDPEPSVAPTALPVDLDSVKEHLRLGNITDEDRRLADEIIPAAIERVQSDCRRALMTQTRILRLDEFPEEIELRICPVVSVSSITYIDGDGETQTLATADYSVDAHREPCRIIPAFGEYWPTTRDVQNAVTVTFVAGYSSAAVVPAIAKRAILLACQMEYYGGCSEAEMAYDSAISRLQWGGYV